MTKIIGSMIILEREPDDKCELCGKTAELRPYGPNGERICFKCGMKDEAETRKKIRERFKGVGERN